MFLRLGATHPDPSSSARPSAGRPPGCALADRLWRCAADSRDGTRVTGCSDIGPPSVVSFGDRPCPRPVRRRTHLRVDRPRVWECHACDHAVRVPDPVPGGRICSARRVGRNSQAQRPIAGGRGAYSVVRHPLYLGTSWSSSVHSSRRSGGSRSSSLSWLYPSGHHLEEGFLETSFGSLPQWAASRRRSFPRQPLVHALAISLKKVLVTSRPSPNRRRHHPHQLACDWRRHRVEPRGDPHRPLGSVWSSTACGRSGRTPDSSRPARRARAQSLRASR
jgi:hypothetical protein